MHMHVVHAWNAPMKQLGNAYVHPYTKYTPALAIEIIRRQQVSLHIHGVLDMGRYSRPP